MMTQTRREARLQVVHDHIQFEREHALDELVRTFGNSPQWHNKPGNEVFSGHDEIRGFYSDLFQGFPDFWLDIQSEHVTDEAVIVEGRFGGTHTGTWMGLAPTSKKVGVSFCAVFSFTDDDRLKSETAYYDRYSILSQLGVVPAS
jgi:steroid delta-isomerase-like uncharacterized protein